MNDIFYMNEALKFAKKAFRQDEIPVGAVVVDNSNGEIIGRGYNMCEQLRSPIKHAEMIALEQAAESKKSWRLANATLYVTLEPCTMCTGAIINSRISRVVFGAYDKRAGACCSSVNLFEITKTHTPEITGGILKDECQSVLSDFFKNKRKEKSHKPELWDLFDKNRNPLGKTHIRGELLPEGAYHTVIVVITKNLKEEVLITKRSSEKKNSPGMWECTTGSVVAGESSISGACRELMEETGIKRKKECFKLIKPVAYKHTFTDCYLLKTDVADDEIKLQKGETEDYKWVNKETFERMEQNDLIFTPDREQYVLLKELIWK